MCSNERKVNDERNHLLNIFPEEIWLQIFDKITNQDDQERFCNSSLFVRSLFLPQRTQFLFKNVWGILGRKYEENITKPGSAYRGEDEASDDSGDAQLDQEESNDDNNNIEDLHFKKMFFVNFLCRIRLVCTSWSDAVSYFYQTHQLHFEPLNYTPSTFLEKWTYSKTQETFSDEIPQSVAVFLSHFNQTHNGDRNPFFGKSVIIEFTYGDSGTQTCYVSNLFYLLSKYGHHIWYCTMKINDVFSSREALYIRIVAVLKMMVNLKVLRLVIQPHWTYYHGKVRTDLLEKLQTEISTQPLPTLRDLKMLSTRNVITPIFQELVRTNAHVSMLYIVRLREQDDYDIYTVPLPNLKNLSISFYSQQDFEKLMDPKVKWSLSKLCINIDPVEFIEWQRIFEVLQKNWANSLTHLTINLPEAKKREHKNEIYQKGAALQLRLPHLKCLDMTVRNLTCLDFLLTLKSSLLDLHIRIIVNGDVNDGFADADNLERGRIIKFLSCASRPFESNIWTLFPKLDRASLDQYTRLYSPTYSGYLTEREEWSHSRREWENRTIGDSDANATLAHWRRKM